MKEIKETQTKTYEVTKYQAFDGEKFDTGEECWKYENSAAGVLLCKIDDFVVNTKFSFEPDENEENHYKVAIPRNNSDIDLLNRLYKLYNGKFKPDVYFSSNDIGTCIFIGFRYDCANKGVLDWVWFYKLNKIISEATLNKYQVKLIENNED